VNKTTLTTLLAVAIAGGFLGCGKSKEIVIGGIGPVTGDAATFGVSSRNGCEMAVNEWNAKGGVLGKQVKVLFNDDKGDPAEGATVCTKLIQQDKSVAIIGSVLSKVDLAAGPICQNAKVPMLVPSATNPRVTQVGDWIFRSCYIDTFQGLVCARFCLDTLKAKKAAIFFDVGDDYSKGFAEYFKTNYTKLGGALTANEGHPSGVVDFKAQLTKILATNPDVIFSGDHYNDAALMCKQARELGYKGPVLGGGGWESPKLIEVGGAAMNNTYYTNDYTPDATTPAVQTFVAAYKAKYNEVPDAVAALGYDAMNLMLDSIQKAGSTEHEAIRTAMQKEAWSGVTGNIKFDDKRESVKSVVVLAIKDGKVGFHSVVNP
jgi:branched-chain amino acid transport system substrate-binding protein